MEPKVTTGYDTPTKTGFGPIVAINPLFTIHHVSGNPLCVINLQAVVDMEAIGERHLKVLFEYGTEKEYILTNAKETAWDVLKAFGEPVIS